MPQRFYPIFLRDEATQAQNWGTVLTAYERRRSQHVPFLFMPPALRKSPKCHKSVDSTPFSFFDLAPQILN